MNVHANPIVLHMAFERLQFETGFDVVALIAERDRLREILGRAARMAESERAGMVIQILREAQ